MELEEAIKRFNEIKEEYNRFDGLRKYVESMDFLLNHLTKQDKMIDEMIKVMSDRNICKYFIENYCKHYAGENKKTCDVCIKRYFEKKA